jgi:hypothetical protein
MDKYANQIEESALVINNTYKITTKKGDILAKFVGRNKNEGLHFVLDANKHTIVLKVSEIQNIYEQ